MIFLVAVLLLHAPDGQQIRVIPEQVTSMRAPKPKSSEHFIEGVNCMINLSDGKFVAVVEACSTVQKMLEDAR